MSTQTEARGTAQSPLEQYASYPFATDQVYQQGLASILANGALTNTTSTDEKDEILRRAQVFYFNKTTRNALSLDEVREYEQSQWNKCTTQPEASIRSPPPAPAPDPLAPSNASERASVEEPHVLTFAELKELIETGRLDSIPNNKVIPNDLNEAPPSQSTAQTRKKPWEIASENSNENGSTSVSSN